MKSHLIKGRRGAQVAVTLRAAAIVAVAAASAWGVSVSGQSAPAHEGKGAAAASTPRMPDGRPDLNGMWEKSEGSGVGAGPLREAKTQADGKSVCIANCGEETKGNGLGVKRLAPAFPKYKPELLAKVKTLDERQVFEDPALRCMPPGVPRIGPPPRIVQTAREVVFLYDDLSGNFFRLIPIDGRRARTDTDASYLGDSLGRWEGDTLVIETTNFNADTWLTDNGAFHSEKLRVVERVRRVGNTLEYEATAYDPEVLVEPFVTTPRTLMLGTHEVVETPPCVERDIQRVPDLQHHGNLR